MWNQRRAYTRFHPLSTPIPRHTTIGEPEHAKIAKDDARAKTFAKHHLFACSSTRPCTANHRLAWCDGIRCVRTPFFIHCGFSILNYRSQLCRLFSHIYSHSVRRLHCGWFGLYPQNGGCASSISEYRISQSFIPDQLTFSASNVFSLLRHKVIRTISAFIFWFGIARINYNMQQLCFQVDGH